MLLTLTGSAMGLTPKPGAHLPLGCILGAQDPEGERLGTLNGVSHLCLGLESSRGLQTATGSPISFWPELRHKGVEDARNWVLLG